MAYSEILLEVADGVALVPPERPRPAGLPVAAVAGSLSGLCGRARRRGGDAAGAPAPRPTRGQPQLAGRAASSQVAAAAAPPRRQAAAAPATRPCASGAGRSGGGRGPRGWGCGGRGGCPPPTRPRGDGVRLARHHRRSAEGAYRLATRLEGLPIKVCQFVGSRADILPAEYVEVLSQLQDRVPPRPLDTFLPLLRRELGRPVEAAFAELDPAPLASASLAQVHRGRLRDGREVAVKMQYPDIERIVRVDLRSFAVLIGVLARLERDFDFRALIREVEKYVPLELDFVHEADNAERMARHLGGRPDILVPAIVRELSTRRLRRTTVRGDRGGRPGTDRDRLPRPRLSHERSVR